MAPTDEELGRRTAVYPTERRQSVASHDETNCPVIETSEKLVEFRMLVGITTHGSFKAPRGFDTSKKPIITTSGRPAPNVGVYATVVRNEVKCKQGYRNTSRLINGCLGLQIIVAAALTALGASNGSRSAVTVFGAVNTVIAGFLTYLKGSGLPNRLKYFQLEWSKVREYIEQRERDLSIGRPIDVQGEVENIRVMFEEVKGDIEANRPDRFTGGSSSRKPTVTATAHSTGGRLQSYDSRLTDELNELKRRSSGLRRDNGSIEKEVAAQGKTSTNEVDNFRTHLADDLRKLKSTLQEKMRDVAHLEQHIEAHGQKVESKDVEVEMEKDANDRAKEIGD